MEATTSAWLDGYWEWAWEWARVCGYLGYLGSVLISDFAVAADKQEVRKAIQSRLQHLIVLYPALESRRAG
jgi:hypothetical protein